MALNSSGAISLAGSTTGESIAIELGQSATGTIALNDTVVRDLAGVASGAITMPGDFWGKSSIIVGPIYYAGDNTNGELGNGNRSFVGGTPAIGGYSRTDWVHIAFSSLEGAPPVVAIDDSGRLWTWGRNNYGQLGQNDNIHRSSPTQIGAATNWESVASGGWQNTDRGMGGAVNSSGQAYVWGDNYFQQITNWARTPVSFPPREPTSSPCQLGTGSINQANNTLITSVSRLFLAGSNCYALKTNGTMYAGGRNYQGGCGINYPYGDVAYEPVAGYSDWIKGSMACSGSFNGFFLRSNGLLYSAGNPIYGAMGNNESSAALKSSPVQVLGSGYVDVIGNFYGGMAIRSNGTLWAWGRNSYGQCGQNNIVEYSSPVQIGSLTTWEKFQNDNAPERAVAIIKSDGTIWGLGLVQRIDPNYSAIEYSSPVQLFSTFTSSQTLSEFAAANDKGAFFLVD